MPQKSCPCVLSEKNNSELAALLKQSLSMRTLVSVNEVGKMLLSFGGAPLTKEEQHLLLCGVEVIESDLKNAQAILSAVRKKMIGGEEAANSLLRD